MKNKYLRYDPDVDETEKLAIEEYNKNPIKGAGDGTWVNACERVKRSYRRKAWLKRLKNGS